MRRALVLLAFRFFAAGAQAPEELLDEYTATGSEHALTAARSAIAALPPSHRANLLSARLQMAEGKAESALEQAKVLNRNMPDDLDTYALIVDAALTLGRVEDGEKSAQWMLNLRPEDVRSLMRGAAVREALKDDEGAAQMLVDAFARTSRHELAVRAAIGVSLARVNRRLGRAAAAARLLDQVQALIPGYKPALAVRQDMESKQ